jgi:uncharacterized protein (TIGR02444 family)
MPGTSRDNPFWRFSLNVYAAPGVEAECLALQATHDVDVNLLLFCAWAGAQERWQLATADIDRLGEAVQAWQEAVVKPLRSARRALKTLRPQNPAAHDLRSRIAADELEAERIEQAMLFALASERDPASDTGAEADVVAVVRDNVALLLDGRATTLPEALIAAAACAAATGRSCQG